MNSTERNIPSSKTVRAWLSDCRRELAALTRLYEAARTREAARVRRAKVAKPDDDDSGQ